MNKRIGAAAVGVAAAISAFGGALTMLGGSGDAASAKSTRAAHAVTRRAASPRAVAHTAAATPVKQVFMTLAGIPGDVTNSKFPGAVALTTYGVGATSPPPAAGGGGAGRPSFKDLTVTYQADRSLPPLEHDVFSGTHLTSVVITELDAAAHPLRTVTLTNATPDGVQTNTTAPGQAMVTVSFAYGMIQTTDFANPDGASPTAVATCWNVTTNASC